MIVTYAAKITEENYKTLETDIAMFDLNVDYLKYELMDAAEFGVDIYAFLSVNYETKQATFTTKEDDGSPSSWHFCNGMTRGQYFKEVRFNNPKPR
ncbi:MAG TPA: hypothetical protein VH187_16590 [Scandinavium sp.]|jgi:hypothetical protein|uniref:hypothetical protein n=1 Tax=Scandinavium sp. TaxID=2830653 RepID=UPI002E2F3FBF|nr:hypothetical protein [Scandinavium sp.]HEX4502756.1 hypothetical protein [Scandinavium sp.]